MKIINPKVQIERSEEIISQQFFQIETKKKEIENFLNLKDHLIQQFHIERHNWNQLVHQFQKSSENLDSNNKNELD
jgi:hypothetical protein